MTIDLTASTSGRAAEAGDLLEQRFALLAGRRLRGCGRCGRGEPLQADQRGAQPDLRGAPACARSSAWRRSRPARARALLPRAAAAPPPRLPARTCRDTRSSWPYRAPRRSQSAQGRRRRGRRPRRRARPRPRPPPRPRDPVEQRREPLLAEPAEHERVQDDRHVAAVFAQSVDLRLEPGDEAVGLERVGRPAICSRADAERRQHAAGVDVAPLEGQQGDAVLEAGAGAGRASSSAGRPRAGRSCRPRRAAPPGGRKPAISRPSSRERREPRSRFAACSAAVSPPHCSWRQAWKATSWPRASISRSSSG